MMANLFTITVISFSFFLIILFFNWKKRKKPIYSFEVQISDSIYSICHAKTVLTVYTTSPNIFDMPCQIFLTKKNCKKNIPDWDPKFFYIKYGIKFSNIDSEGNLSKFYECGFF